MIRWSYLIFSKLHGSSQSQWLKWTQGNEVPAPSVTRIHHSHTS